MLDRRGGRKSNSENFTKEKTEKIKDPGGCLLMDYKESTSEFSLHCNEYSYNRKTKGRGRATHLTQLFWPSLFQFKLWELNQSKYCANLWVKLLPLYKFEYSFIRVLELLGIRELILFKFFTLITQIVIFFSLYEEGRLYIIFFNK